jgi:hypothetical protein
MGGVPRESFQLNDQMQSQPSVLESDFIVDGIRYHYGFKCDDDAFLSEWLYAYPHNRRLLMFERSGDKVRFGSHFKGAKHTVAELMRSNSLFLSTATQNGHKELTKIFAFFRQSTISLNVMLENESVNKSFRKDQIDVRVFQFLKQIGTGVEGYRQIEFELSEAEKSLRNVVNAKLREEFGEKFGGEVSDSSRGKSYRIEFEHKTSTGDSLYFGLERLSLGTRRLLLLLNMAFRALDQGSLLLIDEIDAGLHTLAAAQMVQLFSDKRTNPNGAQMIAVTHDPSLLNAPCLRRDQIWFCEKDNGGSTDVFPLSDIKSRTTDDFQQGYLQGRYGAIPFSGDLSSLVGAK